MENFFWFAYDELIKQDEGSLTDINYWEKNPMAALPAWVTIVKEKIKGLSEVENDWSGNDN